ncbi:MAG: LPS assembly lipoprotein LptE [Gammaproteobacteria bacterium]|nr:LPS assembly lipoprotein LptE [Gammaproteobacteria bacterium]
MQSAIRQLLLVISLLLLTSCGFHLRGSEPLAPPLHNLYIQSQDPYSQLIRFLKQALKQSGVHFAETPQSASAILEIINERQVQQLLSVGGTQQTRVYNLTLIVAYQLTDPHGRPIANRQEATETRTVTIQANQILGGSNEQSNLFQLMRRAIIFTIMRHLSSLDVTNALMQTEPAASVPKKG